MNAKSASSAMMGLRVSRFKLCFNSGSLGVRFARRGRAYERDVVAEFDGVEGSHTFSDAVFMKIT